MIKKSIKKLFFAKLNNNQINQGSVSIAKKVDIIFVSFYNFCWPKLHQESMNFLSFCLDNPREKNYIISKNNRWKNWRKKLTFESKLLFNNLPQNSSWIAVWFASNFMIGKIDCLIFFLSFSICSFNSFICWLHALVSSPSIFSCFK